MDTNILIVAAVVLIIVILLTSSGRRRGGDYGHRRDYRDDYDRGGHHHGGHHHGPHYDSRTSHYDTGRERHRDGGAYRAGRPAPVTFVAPKPRENPNQKSAPGTAVNRPPAGNKTLRQEGAPHGHNIKGSGNL